MERWVYSFKSTGTRTLTEAEIGAIKLKASLSRRKSVSWAVLSVFLGLMIFLSIAEATSTAWIGWPLLVFFGVTFCMAFDHVGKNDLLRKLLVRAAREVVVETFVKEVAPDSVRAKYSAFRASDDAGDYSGPPFWVAEEDLFKLLTLTSGGPSTTFESLAHDDVLLLVDGKIVNTIQNLHVVCVEA